MENLGYTIEYKPLQSTGWDQLKASTIEGFNVQLKK